MNNLQKMFDAFGDATRRVRSDYHVCLGDLIAALENSDDLPVRFDRGGYPAKPHSYRGYYSDLALEPQDQPVKSKTLLSELKDVLNKELTGYKGGEFLMDPKTPVWRSHYGTTGEAVIKIIIEEDAIVLETKEQG